MTRFDFATYKQLDRIFKHLAIDFDKFNETDEIVRIGDWGYVLATTYEEVCGTRETAQRYLWVSNNEHRYDSTIKVIEECNKFKVDDLDFDEGDDVVYYTTGADE